METGQFLGVEKREAGARLIMKHNATAWCVVPEERDIKSVRCCMVLHMRLLKSLLTSGIPLQAGSPH